MERMIISEDLIRPQMLQLREFRPFKSSDEYLWAMKEDLSDWLNTLYPDLNITPHNFMECLETGVTLCKHANNVRLACIDWLTAGRKLPKCWGREWKMPNGEVTVNSNARPETFFARDNVHNFITWCRKLGIFDCLLFESDDLILRKNEKSVILCLLEVARRGSHFGMAAPLLVQYEKEIDRDIAKDTGQDLSSSGEEEESFQEHGPMPQIITNDLRSLDEMVRDLVERCTCPTQFPMIRITEGKYRIGNTKLMIYVRILRNHVMVRVGGGWTTLGAFLARHDPCRHKTTVSSKFIMKNDGSSPKMKVEYERRDHLGPFEPVAHSTPTYNSSSNNKKSLDLSDSSSEISDEGYKTSDNSKVLLDTPKGSGGGMKGYHHARSKSNALRARSLSTDEERPDSRSTDEELGHTTENESLRRRSCGPNPLMKSSSSSIVVTVNRVPGGLGSRSASCERGSMRQPLRQTQSPASSSNTTTINGHKRTSSVGSGVRKTISSNNGIITTPTATRKVYTVPSPPTRSLSAGGTVEFYRNSTASTRPTARRGGPAVGRATGTTGRMGSIAGKNTWNGGSNCGGGGRRQRANLFQAPYFQQGNNPQQRVGGDSMDQLDQTDAEDKTEYPDLAMWIKKALELDLDADKISHIELAIKQFESRREVSPEHSNIADLHHASSSLPYSVNDTPTSSNSLTPKTLAIRKRNDNGVTKIPKPKFY